MPKNDFLDQANTEQTIILPKHNHWKWLFIILLLIVLGVGGWYFWKQQRIKAVDTFFECRDAHGLILESYPERCVLNGKSFTNPDQTPPEEPKPTTEEPQAEEPKLASYTDTTNNFTVQYPADFVQSKKEVFAPYSNSQTSITSENFAHSIPVKYCSPKGDCIPNTTDISMAFSVVNSSLATINQSKIKSELKDFSAGENSFRSFSQGVEGEGIYYYFIGLPNKKTLMISRTYIDEKILTSYKTAKDFISKTDQDKLALQILSSLSFDSPVSVKNTTYGFTFQYGSEFVVRPEVKSDSIDEAFFIAVGKPLHALALGQNVFPKSNLGQAFLTIATSDEIKKESECKQFSEDSNPKPLTGTLTINGVTWYTGNVIGAAAGTQVRTKIYHAFKNNRCFEISTRTFISNIANYEPGAVTAVDESAIQKKFDTIINSLAFTK
jgi:hypothetical protein